MQEELTIAYHAQKTPEKAAVIMGESGAVMTFAELEARANQGAHLLRSLGLRAGDVLAFCVENSQKFFHIAWAALRCGLKVIPISTKLTSKEISVIVEDSAARVLITSPCIGDAFARIPHGAKDATLFALNGPAPGYRSWDDEVAAFPTRRIVDEQEGIEMLYSSGTTGRPKGIVYLAPPGGYRGGRMAALDAMGRLSLGADSVYLSPAPLYHSAPFAYSLGFHLKGATVVVMESFDPERALALIERYKVTISQWVPTHFVRMLKLPEDIRRKYGVSSLRLALHAAAPCPIEVKQRMIEWWGPILLEYYGSTEQTSLTFIDSRDWLAHPGSVGQCALGKIHICDEAGEPLPAGQIGQIYSEGSASFLYHNDPQKTAGTRNRHGWTTVGDMGRLDENGYLYLCDRKDFMIITGGVNVYPQEIESLLVMHPRIADAAVIGTPDADFGQIVTAVVQLVDMKDATPALAQEIKDWLRESVSSVKIPKRIEFRASLPRLPTGKMVKRELQKEYS